MSQHRCAILYTVAVLRANIEWDNTCISKKVNIMICFSVIIDDSDESYFSHKPEVFWAATGHHYNPSAMQVIKSGPKWGSF